MVSLNAVPQPLVTVMQSRSDPLYAGTELMLTANIAFSESNEVIIPLSITVKWSRGNNTIGNDTRTSVSAVSGSGGMYTASFNYSPISISENGTFTATVVVSPDDESAYSNPVIASDTFSLNILGKYYLYSI